MEEKYTNNLPMSEEMELRRRVGRREVRVEWGAFLEDMGPWEVFLTQTFRYKCGQPLVEDFVKRLFEVAGPEQAFIVAERGRGSIGPHIHALLGRMSINLPNRTDDLQALRKHFWKRWGRCQIDEFIPGLGAGHYVSKEMCEVSYSPIYAWGIGQEKMHRREIRNRLNRDGAAAFRM